MKQYYAPAYTLKKGYKAFQFEPLKDGRVFFGGFWHRVGEGVFESPIEAAAQAEVLRLARVAVLRKGLAKLEALTYGASK